MFRLTIFMLVCIVAANAVSKLEALFREHAFKSGSECLSEVGASMDDLNSIVNQNIPTTRAGMCLITCIHEKFGVQDKNGKMLVDGLLAFLELIKDDPPYYELVKEHFLHCFNTVSQEDEKCVIGTNLMSCIALDGRKKGIFDE